jgi:beta-methylmalyl-CoA/(S)-malyl-CoA lyase
MTHRLCRTFQTAPVAVPREDSAKYLRSGLAAEGFQAPDWLVPDIEDGTAPDMKAEGLENLLELLPEYAPDFEGTIWPRIQWDYDRPEIKERGREEIETIVAEVGEHVDGVVIPKVGRLDDVEDALEAVAEAEREAGLEEGSIEAALIVETAQAKSDLREIAALGAENRLAGLVFGPVDYAAELGGQARGDDGPAWSGLLEDLSNEASANGLVAIGGPFDQLFAERAGVTYFNAEGYAEQIEHEAAVGLDGSWSLHPKQTTIANRIHMPSPEELRGDVSRIEKFHEARSGGTGAVTVDGQMIDEATYKTFCNTVETAQAIHDRHPEQAETMYDETLLKRALDLETTR